MGIDSTFSSSCTAATLGLLFVLTLSKGAGPFRGVLESSSLGTERLVRGLLVDSFCIVTVADWMSKEGFMVLFRLISPPSQVVQNARRWRHQRLGDPFEGAWKRSSQFIDPDVPVTFLSSRSAACEPQPREGPYICEDTGIKVALFCKLPYCRATPVNVNFELVVVVPLRENPLLAPATVV